MSATPFLDEISRAEQIGGVFLWNDFLHMEDAADNFRTLDDDTKMPWDLKPRLGFERLQQHAYKFSRTEKEITKSEGLALVDGLCKKIESRFDCQITDVFCNRFQDPEHMVDWHRDTYGAHIFVLSLGSQRNVQFRPDKTGVVETIRPKTGDVYFMPLQLNKTQKHRVCAADEEQSPRISLVFFASVPKYAKEYKISAMDHITGAFTSIIS